MREGTIITDVKKRKKKTTTAQSPLTERESSVSVGEIIRGRKGESERAREGERVGGGFSQLLPYIFNSSFLKCFN